MVTVFYVIQGSGKPLEVLLLEKNRGNKHDWYCRFLFLQACADHSDIVHLSPALVNENTSLKTELAELRGDVANDGVISCLEGGEMYTFHGGSFTFVISYVFKTFLN